jgi:hypothetical protein
VATLKEMELAASLVNGNEANLVRLVRGSSKIFKAFFENNESPNIKVSACQVMNSRRKSGEVFAKEGFE